MRQRNPKPYKLDGNGSLDSYYYPEMDSNDYDDSDMSPLLRVQTEMLSSPPLPPLTPTIISSQKLQRNRNVSIDIPEMNYSETGFSLNHHHNSNVINFNSTSQQFHQRSIKIEQGVQANKETKQIEPKSIHMNGNDHHHHQQQQHNIIKKQHSEKSYEDDDGDSSMYEDYTNAGINDNGNALNEINANKRRKVEIAKDDDYHFLMSMQPYMKQLRGDQKLKIRMKMQKLIFRELYGDGINGSESTGGNEKINRVEVEDKKIHNNENNPENITVEQRDE